MSLRQDLQIISEWITPASRVLDLGCGDGTLLHHLSEDRGVTGYGLELSIDNIAACIERGVNVIQADLDAGLSDFADSSFDFVIMTQALQVVQHPDRLMREMLRVGRQGVVTFPNFGHWTTRLQLTLHGRMPVTPALPSQWFNTENIHLCTLRDFEQLCADSRIRIRKRVVVDSQHRTALPNLLAPNLVGEIGMYLLENGS